MIYFHYCKDYIDNVLPQADKLIRKKLEEYTNRPNLKGINAVASYTGRIYVLQLKNPHTKVILQEHRINTFGEDLLVYFVREAISMGQDHYWLHNYVQIRDGRWLEYNPLPNENEEIALFESELLAQNLDYELKDPPPYNLTKWHRDYELRVDYDVYETEEWVKFAISNSPNDGMADHTDLYRLVLLEITKETGTRATINVLKKNQTESIEVAIYNDTAVIYSRINLSTEKNTLFLLHNGAQIASQNNHWENIKSHYAKIEPQFGDIESIQRTASRAYPKWAIDRIVLWKEIEKNSETGNLSLLPEQTNFLKKFKFPSYINGQAGSGKSTMLYYLFSNAYFYKCLGQIDGDIIFLTENENLLKHTKKSVIELLQCNTDFELNLEDIANVDRHFSSFKNFLLSLLPLDVKEFPAEKYLDFSKFKILYEASHIPSHIKTRYTSELVWFAITTYIYGYDLNYQISSENYDELMPKEGKELLPKEVLKGIEKDVLNPFYKKLIENEGYWDKLKIIRYIRNNVKHTKTYEVVFCDEAQDFSRVELRFILDLSEYIQYDLSTTEQVPIVFAGDALQTVNPTGFRAAEVKDMLYEQLKEIAGFNLKDDLEYAPDFNYRSSQAIVNVANAVQYFRKKTFDAKIKKPQIAKRPELDKDYHLNVFIDYDTVLNDSELKKRLEYKTFIIPTNSDEKEDYINQNQLLKNFTNVKTAVEAKGIDYEQVVLYGFGEFADKIKTKEEYETRFFYNKLYVAVTRAQSELVIIDEKNVGCLFWKNLINDYSKSEWAKISNSNENEIANTICYDANQIPNIKISTPETALDSALKDKRQGIFDENPGLLRVAASQFMKLGEKKESYICLGLMHEYQEQWKEAATCYLKKEVGKEGFEMAALVYWKGKLLTELKIIDGNIRSEIQTLRLLVVELFENDTLTFSDLQKLYNNRESLRKLILQTSWHDEIIEKLVGMFNNVKDEEQIKFLLDIFEELASINEGKLWLLIGEKQFHLRRYDRAIDAFDRISYDGELYIKSKIEIARRGDNFSDCIFWLGRLVIESKNESEKTSSEKEILNLYSLNKIALKSENNPYAYLYVYGAYLVRKPIDTNLIELAKLAEASFTNKNELSDYYGLLLESARLQPNIVNYAIERWAKNKFLISKDVVGINEEYKKYAVTNKIKYHQFNLKELNEIKEIPDVILPNPSYHIENITIRNFRGFKDVKIENLGLFNLVVGDNNIGKTSFLEALLFTPNKAEYLERLAFSYIERKNIQPDKEDKSNVKRIYYNLEDSFINDFKNCDEKKFNIEFIIEKGRATWRYRVQIENDLANIDSSFNNIIYDNTDFKIISDLAFLDSIKQPFMPYGKGFGIDLAQVYHDEIVMKPKIEMAFIKNLEFFIPKIQRVIADTKNGTIDLIDGEYPDEIRPLHQYGEGVNKLFRIMLLLALHKGKLLLLDEIDAGIHYTRFKEFWKIILEIAKKDGTQIIATTHNDECIRYFNDELTDLGEDYQKESRVIQLKKVNNTLKIRSYEFNSFNLALIDGREIRGGE